MAMPMATATATAAASAVAFVATAAIAATNYSSLFPTRVFFPLPLLSALQAFAAILCHAAFANLVALGRFCLS